MSLSRPTNTNPNPANKFFQWSGETGKFRYYDREKGENIFIDEPFDFIVLDTLATVAGYCDEDESGFYSNEVRSLASEDLIIRTKNGIKESGKWKDIEDSVKAKGGKFASSVYVAVIDEDGELELCNLKLFGSSISQWIEFNKNNRNSIGVSLTGSEKAKKGKTVYFKPLFETLEIDDALLNKARELDEQLQVYLDSYFDYAETNSTEKVKSAKVGSTNDSSSEELNDEDEDGDIPF